MISELPVDIGTFCRTTGGRLVASLGPLGPARRFAVDEAFDTVLTLRTGGAVLGGAMSPRFLGIAGRLKDVAPFD